MAAPAHPPCPLGLGDGTSPSLDGPNPDRPLKPEDTGHMHFFRTNKNNFNLKMTDKEFSLESLQSPLCYVNPQSCLTLCYPKDNHWRSLPVISVMHT